MSISFDKQFKAWAERVREEFSERVLNIEVTSGIGKYNEIPWVSLDIDTDDKVIKITGNKLGEIYVEAITFPDENPIAVKAPSMKLDYEQKLQAYVDQLVD